MSTGVASAAPLDAPPGPPLARLGAARATGALVAYFGAQTLAGIVVGAAAGISFVVGSRDLGPSGLEAVVRAVTPLGAVVGVAVGGLLVAHLARVWAGPLAAVPGPDGVRFAWGDRRQLAAGAAAGALLAALYLAGAGLLATPPAPEAFGPATRMAAAPGWPRWAWAFLAVVLAPPAEEYLFRGVLLAGFSRSWGRGAAGVIVSLLFAAVHLPETLPFWPAALATTSLGILALALRWRTERLGPAVAAHSAYNLALALSLLAS